MSSGRREVEKKTIKCGETLKEANVTWKTSHEHLKYQLNYWTVKERSSSSTD